MGDPSDKTAIGPVASKAQFDKIQGLLQKGIEEGATVVVGGPGRPDTGAFSGLMINNFLYLGALGWLIYLLVAPGTSGPNRFGPPPE